MSSIAPSPGKAERVGPIVPVASIHWLRKAVNHPLLPSLLVTVLTYSLLAILWRHGLFQFFELQLYDRLVRARQHTTAEASRIVVIGITEEDIQRGKSYPIPDDVLLTALQKLTAAGPAAVVVDVYRDLPVPGQDPEATERLAEFWKANENILAIERLGLNEQPSVRRPIFLRHDDYNHQVGFNDFPVDYAVDDTARRALLIMDDKDEAHYSVAFIAAQLCLQPLGLELDLGTAERSISLGRSTIPRFRPNDGAYVDADARGFQILLDFRGPENFQTYTFTDVLADKVPPEALRGNVVLIGLLASSMKDHLITPLAKRFPGVMLHAHAVHQLLRQAIDGQRPIRFASESQETLWLLFWCALGALIGLHVKSPVGFVLSMTAAAGTLFGGYWFAFYADLWLPAVTPATGFFVAAVLGTSFQAYVEKKERDVLMQLFSRHVSSEIAINIWHHRDQFMDGHIPKAQDVKATVIFTDLAGFSGKAETLRPDALLAWLNEYMEVMSTLVEKHGGMVNKYMGDAIMAVFGVPIPRTRESEIRADAVNAVNCALQMAQELDRLNHSWAERGLPTTHMRIGVATGDLIGGSIGGLKRLEYTVTGDTVVIAKRLESAKKEATLEKASLSTRILIAESTNAMLGSRFKVRGIGPMILEGKHLSVDVFVVIGLEGATT